MNHLVDRRRLAAGLVLAGVAQRVPERVGGEQGVDEAVAMLALVYFAPIASLTAAKKLVSVA
jgi:hypothetical protein